MDRAASLRGQLGTASALGAALLAGTAGVSLTVLAWRDAQERLLDDIALAAFVASEADDPVRSPAPDGGSGSFVVTFDVNGEVLDQTADLTEDLVFDLTEDVWAGTLFEEDAVQISYEPSGSEAELSVAGVQCASLEVCDTVIVGVYHRSLVSYLWSNLVLILAPILLVGALAGLGARWLVGRSLRPVDKMRQELAKITETSLSDRVAVPATGDELAELADTFNETIARLDKAVQANEHFVADAAHELRSPIAGVRAAIELESAKKPGGILDDALVEVDRAGRLIEDLLVLARRRGSGPRKAVDVDLDDLVRAELRSLSSRYEAISFQSTIEPVRVRGHDDSLRRLVSNLMENACLYGSGQVHVVVVTRDGVSTLEVHDDGSGIPPEEAERIFERFARLDESRSRVTGGSGLGLAIASEIAADHGAVLKVLGSGLGGACFQLTFAAQFAK